MKSDDTNKPERRCLQRLKLSGPSAAPGLELMERIAHNRKPSEEDLAILAAWSFKFPVKIVSSLPD